MASRSAFFLWSGVAATTYAVYAFLNYYTYSGVHLISAEKAKEYIDLGLIERVIDVRTQTERDTLGFYKDSLHIPVTSFDDSQELENLKNISDDIGILVYCNTGQRARRASEKLANMGFKNVYYIAGPYSELL